MLDINNKVQALVNVRGLIVELINQQRWHMDFQQPRIWNSVWLIWIRGNMNPKGVYLLLLHFFILSYPFLLSYPRYVMNCWSETLSWLDGLTVALLFHLSPNGNRQCVVSCPLPIVSGTLRPSRLSSPQRHTHLWVTVWQTLEQRIQLFQRTSIIPNRKVLLWAKVW